MQYKANSVKLSKRQLDCARLLLQGMNFREIAVSLDLSPRTVESYLQDIKEKLKCRNKVELILKLLQIVKVTRVGNKEK